MSQLILLHQTKPPLILVEEIMDRFSSTIKRSYSPSCLAMGLKKTTHTDDKHKIQQLCFEHQTDTIFLKDSFDPKHIQLLAFDMDSTLINIECIDEIARQCGKEKEVSAITEASMRGEITDFSESLRERVKLLKGVTENDLNIVYQHRLQLNPGAKELVLGAQQFGWRTVLVSGGFTFFTERIKQLLGLDEAHSNTLEIHQGLLTGYVLGPIVDGAAKAEFVKSACQHLGINTDCALVMGDGSNDLPMMANAGLSIGFQPKPIVQEKADGTFRFVGLDAALEIFKTE